MVVFLSTLTLYLAFKIINTKGWALYLVAGAIYGAAVSSRLFALGFFFPLVAGHILAQKGDNLVSRMLNALRDRRWLILPFAALGGFAITNPQSVLAVGQFLKAVQVELISERLGSSMGAFKIVAELLSQMKFVYSNLLATTFSPSLFYSKIHSSPISILNLLPLALVLVGLIILLTRRFKLGLMMLVAFISANLFIIPVTLSSPFTHHYLVVVPICALLIGSALDSLWRFVIRTKLAYFRLLLCGITIGAIAFVAIEMLYEATQIHNSKSGKGSFSRRTDYRKWMIDHIPPGSRIAYDRYGTDLIPGYFDVVRKPGFDKGLDYYSKNFDYVIVSWDRIYQYKVFQELLKYKPMALFELEEVDFMPRLAIYKMDRDESNHDRMRNFYTETLPRKNGIETTINDPSFENGELLESWGVRLSHHPYRAWKPIYTYWAWEKTYRPDGKPIEWWDGKNYPPYTLIERASDIRSDGKFSLHIKLAEERPKEPKESEPSAKDKRIQIGQVIPYDLLDWLQYFSIDYYLQCDPAQDKPPGSIKLHFIAESIGGQYLNIETYVLYDSSKGQNPTYNKWHTFNRNIKADFNKPFVRWKDIEFMIFFVEVENSEFGSLDIYVDNIQTLETLALRKFLNDPDRNR
jgi:hypothetical protein